MICPNCGKTVWNAEFCSKCGAPIPSFGGKKKRPVLRVVVGCFAVLFILAGVLAIIDPSSTADMSHESATPIEQESGLEVLDHEITYDGYVRYVSGHIKNNTSRDYSYVLVRINLYEDDVLVETIGDFVNELGAGETWKFDAVILDDNADSYKIIEVQGW